MDRKVQPSESCAHVEEYIGTQEAEVEEVVNVELQDEGSDTSTCHYFVNVHGKITTKEAHTQ